MVSERDRERDKERETKRKRERKIKDPLQLETRFKFEKRIWNAKVGAAKGNRRKVRSRRPLSRLSVRKGDWSDSFTTAVSSRVTSVLHSSIY